MGRSYWFECPKCSYRAKVSGCGDRGLLFFVQTILCRDCRELFDAVTRVKVPDETMSPPGDVRKSKGASSNRAGGQPPSFQAVLNRLPLLRARRLKWVQFKLQCPVSPFHRIQSWNDPDRCPKCGVYLEKGALPFRLWD